MMTFVWIVLAVLAVLLGLFVYGWRNAIRASRVRNRTQRLRQHETISSSG